MDMVRSLGLVAVGLLAWMYFAHPRAVDPVHEVAWAPVAQAAAAAATYEVLAPPAAFPWPATALGGAAADGTLAWRAGFYTPEEAYAAILQRGEFPEQAAQAQRGLGRAGARDGVAAGTVTIAGRKWVRMRATRSPTIAGPWSIEDGTATVVTGSATWPSWRPLAGGCSPVTP